MCVYAGLKKTVLLIFTVAINIYNNVPSAQVSHLKQWSTVPAVWGVICLMLLRDYILALSTTLTLKLYFFGNISEQNTILKNKKIEFAGFL